MDFDFNNDTIIPNTNNGILTIAGNGGLIIPSGPSSSAPALQDGMLRYNTDTGKIVMKQGGGDLLIGTVTAVTVTTANGVSATVSNQGTTPALSFTLGAITPTSVNGVTISGSSTPTLSVTGTSSISGSHTGTSSGTNTGDQTITLTGDVTGSGTGSFSATIGTNVVTNAKLAQVSTATFKGRTTAGTGNVEDLTASQATALLDVATVSLKGLMSATDKSKLDGIASGAQPGTVTSVSVSTANGFAGTVSNPTTTPAITISTTVTGPLVGNGTSVAAAVSGTDFKTINGSSILGAGNLVVSAGAAGSSTQIQFNNAGALAASADFTFDDATNTLGLNGTDTGILIAAVTNEPAAPASGNGRFYSRSIANQILPKWIGPSGVDYVLQSHIGQNNITVWRGGATTTATTFAAQIGAFPYTSASPTAPTIPTLASTNLKTQTYRSVISTGATAGALAYIRGNALRVWRGNAANLGGFYIIHRFGLAGLQAGMRVFAGIQDTAANPTNIDPVTNTTPGRIGMAINTNTGNWNLIHNVTGTAPTSIALGANFPVNTTDLWELVLFCPPNGSTIGYRVFNLSTGNQTSGSITTNIPANTTFLTPSVWCTNNATAAAVTLDFVSTYVETDV